MKLPRKRKAYYSIQCKVCGAWIDRTCQSNHERLSKRHIRAKQVRGA